MTSNFIFIHPTIYKEKNSKFDILCHYSIPYSAESPQEFIGMIFSLLLELHHSLEQECFVYSVNCNFSLFFIFKIREKRKINPVNFRIFAQKFIRIYKQNRKEIVFSPLVFFFFVWLKKKQAILVQNRPLVIPMSL